MLQLSSKRILKAPSKGIPILMYHSVNTKKNRFSVSPDTFRSHLEKLYKAGFVTVPLKDVIERKDYLTRKKAVVLRFDDSRRDQCNYLIQEDGTPQLDPDCAVGIILDFYKKHPSFGKNACFCIIPTMCFQQPAYKKDKLLFLLSEGMELVNHGWDHVSIANATPEDIDNNFGRAMAYWDTVLGPQAAEIQTVAPPYGAQPVQPETVARLRCFSYKGVRYPQKAILYAGRKHHMITPPPTSAACDPYELPALEVTTEQFDEILAQIS